MAKNGFRVMDSDLHVIEPRTLWEDYLDPKFRGRIVTVQDNSGQMRAHVDGKVMPPHLSIETKRKILWDNCARLYKLGGR
jgi:ABC-type Fe3+ transport system substrate-binding protein